MAATDCSCRLEVKVASCLSCSRDDGSEAHLHEMRPRPGSRKRAFKLEGGERSSPSLQHRQPCARGSCCRAWAAQGRSRIATIATGVVFSLRAWQPQNASSLAEEAPLARVVARETSSCTLARPGWRQRQIILEPERSPNAFGVVAGRSQTGGRVRPDSCDKAILARRVQWTQEKGATAGAYRPPDVWLTAAATRSKKSRLDFMWAFRCVGLDSPRVKVHPDFDRIFFTGG